MEEFKSNVSEKETQTHTEEAKIKEAEVKSNRPDRRPGTVYAEPLKAEGNDTLKRLIDEKREAEIAKAEETEQGVRIKFADSQFGREVYEEIVTGYNNQPRVKVVDILIHKGVSVHKYEPELVQKMIKYFGKRAKIVG